METLQKESIYARKQVDLILDEEERSIEDERSFGGSSIEEEEEPKSDGNNTTTQKKFGLDINMIGARKRNTGNNQESDPKKCPLQEMSPWKEQI